MTKTFECTSEITRAPKKTEMKKTPGSASLVVETFDSPVRDDYAKASVTTLRNTYPVRLQCAVIL